MTPRHTSLTETVTEQKTTILKPTLKTPIFQRPTETRLHTPTVRLLDILPTTWTVRLQIALHFTNKTTRIK